VEVGAEGLRVDKGQLANLPAPAAGRQQQPGPSFSLLFLHPLLTCRLCCSWRLPS
jgi:hypothetical protein